MNKDLLIIESLLDEIEYNLNIINESSNEIEILESLKYIKTLKDKILRFFSRRLNKLRGKKVALRNEINRLKNKLEDSSLSDTEKKLLHNKIKNNQKRLLDINKRRNSIIRNREQSRIRSINKRIADIRNKNVLTKMSDKRAERISKRLLKQKERSERLLKYQK